VARNLYGVVGQGDLVFSDSADSGESGLQVMAVPDILMNIKIGR
jgi:hypothetical protein